ncbi:MAG: ABC transporter permease [Eubacteriales bacterium]|nr:ABC transporter permease [Eubacteriales bacterium]MDD3074288.1 ABC transporter permease [Eubacteriales bacterium]MDD4079174.1 ABC transporter permease [Eubacteriales bacterium]MDD4768209.1 ABC transporter permease [Eubacteriales bacterium]
MGINVIKLVFLKELKDIFRDKKTIFMSLVIPLLIFPLLFLVLGGSMDKSMKQVEENLTVAIVDSGNSSLSQFLHNQETIKLVESTDVEADIKSGKILVALEVPTDFDEGIKAEKPVDLVLLYDNASQSSQMAFSAVSSIVDAYSKAVIEQRLLARDISGDLLTPVVIDARTTEKEEEGFGKFMLSLMLPLMLVIFSISGPMGVAVDLGAGEKERGTLEPLLTTQAGRLSLLWGKFFAITVMGLLSTIASLLGLLFSMRQEGGLFQGSAVSIEPVTLVLIGLVTLLLTMFFGALELSISIYARSFKEAQTYISPLMMISFIPTYATYMLDAKNIETYYFHIPLANVSCILKEFLAGIYNVTHIGITFAWIIIYIFAAVLFARYMFSKEEVIFRT